jgi:hypothetical protein
MSGDMGFAVLVEKNASYHIVEIAEGQAEGDQAADRVLVAKNIDNTKNLVPGKAAKGDLEIIL